MDYRDATNERQPSGPVARPSDTEPPADSTGDALELAVRRATDAAVGDGTTGRRGASGARDRRRRVEGAGDAAGTSGQNRDHFDRHGRPEIPWKGGTGDRSDARGRQRSWLHRTPVRALGLVVAVAATVVVASGLTLASRPDEATDAAAPPPPRAAAAGPPEQIPVELYLYRGAPFAGIPQLYWAGRTPGNPPRVGIQAGHFKTHRRPPEQDHLIDSTGARWGSVREVDINRTVSLQVVERLRGAGIEADLLDATVPAGYEADAFISIHADGAWRPQARGFKISAPWRASPASRHLEEAVRGAYGEATGLPEDRYGITYRMKGYHSFSPHRYWHAVAATTPSIIVEMGFVTDAGDREVLVGSPQLAATGVAEGIIRFLEGFDARDLTLRTIPEEQILRVVTDEAPMRAGPEVEAPVVANLRSGTALRSLGTRGEWHEVRAAGGFRSFGWIHARHVSG